MVFKRTGENRKHGREFENDVKMYGIQTIARIWEGINPFENDVKMYGIQTLISFISRFKGLRMM